MDENEIIEYLKDNRGKGVMFAFMPEAVRRWCHEHEDEPVFCFYSVNSWSEEGVRSFYNEVSYCLVKNYAPRRDFDGFFEEFEIDDLGYFFYKGHKYYYREDAKFETEHSDKYKGFGGWLYEMPNCDTEKCQMWTMAPQIVVGKYLYTWTERDEDCGPAIPKKIRFWRYRR